MALAWSCRLEAGHLARCPGLDATDVVVRWAKDSRSLIVSGFAPGNGRTIVEVSLADGSRRTIATISPSDIAGLRRVAPPITSGDGQAYAYRYTQILSDLYVGEVRWRACSKRSPARYLSPVSTATVATILP